MIVDTLLCGGCQFVRLEQRAEETTQTGAEEEGENTVYVSYDSVYV